MSSRPSVDETTRTQVLGKSVWIASIEPHHDYCVGLAGQQYAPDCSSTLSPAVRLHLRQPSLVALEGVASAGAAKRELPVEMRSRPMRGRVGGCCGLWLALGASAHGGEFWTQVAEVENVALRIHWGSLAELNAAARKVGKTSSTEPLGFAVLRKDVATGAFTCDIYIAQSPDRIDRITTLLGHELSHCLGFSHDLRARRNGGVERTESGSGR